MSELTRIGVDTSKSVFTLHGVDAAGQVVFRRSLRRQQMIEFFGQQPPVEVAMEACGGSHHWARALTQLGHRVRLLPAQYVKPFVKRSKNDTHDAEAICIAAGQPSICPVPVKSAAVQAEAMALSVRELLVRQRTQLINALRGHAAEFGLVAATGEKGLAQLQADIAQADDGLLPRPAREALTLLGSEIARVEAQLERLTAHVKKQAAANPVAKRLARIPGIGPIGALSLALRVDASQFKSARHFAAWLGLVPKQNSTGGRTVLGGISRAGDEQLRQVLVLGATSVVRQAAAGRASGLSWLAELLKRKPRKLAAVAWANKMARIAWAMMASGSEYRRGAAA